MEAIYRLRAHAWGARLATFPCSDRWEDPEDSTSLRWTVLYRGEVVAAARLTIAATLVEVPNAEVYRDAAPEISGAVASINRLVVDPAHAKCGLNTWLDSVRLARADGAGARYTVAHTFAGIKRIEALERLGFRAMGESCAYDSGPLSGLNHLSLQTRSSLVLLRCAPMAFA